MKRHVENTRGMKKGTVNGSPQDLKRIRMCPVSIFPMPQQLCKKDSYLRNIRSYGKCSCE